MQYFKFRQFNIRPVRNFISITDRTKANYSRSMEAKYWLGRKNTSRYFAEMAKMKKYFERVRNCWNIKMVPYLTRWHNRIKYFFWHLFPTEQFHIAAYQDQMSYIAILF